MIGLCVTTTCAPRAYRAGSVDQPDNRALRAAHGLQAPLVYFVGTRPGWYRPEWPVFVSDDDPVARRVTLTPGRMVGPYDEREPLLPGDPIERRYALRETRVRLHQARFRARVLPAYANQCTICRLRACPESGHGGRHAAGGARQGRREPRYAAYRGDRGRSIAPPDACMPPWVTFRTGP